MTSFAALFNDDCAIPLSLRTEEQNESCLSTEFAPYKVIVAIAVVAVFASVATDDSIESKSRSKGTKIARAAGGALLVGGIGYGIMVVIRSIERRKYTLSRQQLIRDAANPELARLEMSRSQTNSANLQANANAIQAGTGLAQLFRGR